jgi:hypothetical protein
MKFAYVDETGDQNQSDVFVMTGVLIDAYRLRKYTMMFDKMISGFLIKHPGAPKELKTKNFINGDGGWSKVPSSERKEFLRNICNLITECATLFAVGLSFSRFGDALKGGHGHPFGNDSWLAAALFVTALIQKKMIPSGKKGFTVLICDDNKRGMDHLADALYDCDPWFDPIYQQRKKGRAGKTIWLPLTADQRFDRIVNCAFAIKSHHSSLIQVADAVCYVFRRNIELKSEKEAWEGEKEYFSELSYELQSKRESLGLNPGGSCVEFYKAACHKEWTL